MIVPPNERILHTVIPQANRHIVTTRRDQALPVRRKLHLTNRVRVPIQHRNRNPKTPNIPNLNRLINRRRRDGTIVVLVPVAREDLEFVRRDDHGGSRLANVPHADGAVAGRGSEDVGVARIPDGGVDAVGVFFEGADAGGAVDGPELDGVVPGGGEEGVAADGVPVGGVDLAGVLVEAADGVGGGRKGEVPKFDGSVGHSRNQEVFVVFGPGGVVDAVSGVEGAELGDGARGSEVEDVEATVAEDAEILGCGD
eukprot:TRINITY_DN1069_c0_g1_i1.p2 TRINITY_DN1069_c0_g1~~TRINITY_DN1069_c0_g1_i1.p2  ORF type:complete len:254 (-),score=-3.45 TRINITY_DN1069_c0_g1_i1:138-899(-)